MTDSKKYGHFSPKAYGRSGGSVYLTPDGKETTVTCVCITKERCGFCAWDDLVDVGEVREHVRKEYPSEEARSNDPMRIPNIMAGPRSGFTEMAEGYLGWFSRFCR